MHIIKDLYLSEPPWCQKVKMMQIFWSWPFLLLLTGSSIWLLTHSQDFLSFLICKSIFCKNINHTTLTPFVLKFTRSNYWNYRLSFHSRDFLFLSKMFNFGKERFSYRWLNCFIFGKKKKNQLVTQVRGQIKSEKGEENFWHGKICEIFFVRTMILVWYWWYPCRIWGEEILFLMLR